MASYVPLRGRFSGADPFAEIDDVDSSAVPAQGGARASSAAASGCDSSSNDYTTCPCQGAFETGVPNPIHGNHVVWMAFLHYENSQFRKEEWLRDYFALPTNWLTCKLSGSDIYHCQMFFWNQMQRTFVTFSVDAFQKCVYYNRMKEFSHGWSFLQLNVTAEQERKMYAFLARQAVQEKPFNQIGAYMLFVRPINTGESSWFCSELDVAALQTAGFLQHMLPEETTPANLYDTLKKCGEMEVIESAHPIRSKQNQIFWTNVKARLNDGAANPSSSSPAAASRANSLYDQSAQIDYM